MNFMESLKETIGKEYNSSVTENGAVGFKTTGKSLLDLNFSVSSMRLEEECKIVNRFKRAYLEDKKLAIKWLFFAGDVRGGMGERRLFRTCLKFIAEYDPDIAVKILEIIPEYTRWDNYLPLLGTSLSDKVVAIIVKQLQLDMKDALANKPISLCAKWLPSEKASSKEKRNLAKMLISKMKISNRQYRKMLSNLRSYLDVVEVKMCSNRWDHVDYSVVPSCANLRYKEAFLKHDKERRQDYLKSVEKGEKKINSGVLFPHDVIAQYQARMCSGHEDTDPTLEALWNSLPDYVKGNNNTICVADGSGSMDRYIGNSRTVTALYCANALSIYFAERCSGDFKNKYITFSRNPQLVDFSSCETLRDKIITASLHDEIANTNIEKVFGLILSTAINSNAKQEDIPANVLVLSDMEFDRCAEDGTGKIISGETKLFEQIANTYSQHGYKLPRLIFWNLNSRTNTIPIVENQLGVSLVSGFSPAIMNSILSGETDPYQSLLKQINAPRYDLVEFSLDSDNKSRTLM